MLMPLIGHMPLEVTFHHLPPSAAVEAAARRRAAQLERIVSPLTGCAVALDAPHRHRHTGRPYVAHIRLRVPGAEIVASHEQGHADPYAALHAAFDAVSRQLQDYLQRRHGEVKTHPP